MSRCFLGMVSFFALLCVMGCCTVLGEEHTILDDYAISQADYGTFPQALSMDADLSLPENMEAFDAWWESLETRQNAEIENPDGLKRFVENSSRSLLKSEIPENMIYSPLSLWLELDLIAQLTTGQSRSQILDVLGEETLESLSAQTESLWRSQYWDDGKAACIPGVSLWLDQKVGIDEGDVSELSTEHMTSVFHGDVRNPEYNHALQYWINQMTRGQLDEAVSSLQFDQNALLSAASTLYCNGRWETPFLVEDTSPSVFHAPDNDIELDFLNARDRDTLYYGTGFTACIRGVGESQKAAFVLPDSTTSIEELVEDSEVFRFLDSPETWENQEELMVTFSMPKLDLESELSLNSSLESMGIVDIFSEEKADFSEILVSNDPLSVSSLLQLARVKMDEEGIEAAAVTISNVLGALLMPEKEVDFILDRPFMFALLGPKNVPLFIGAVYYP